MVIISYISYISLYIGFNTIFYSIIERKTRYPLNKTYDPDLGIIPILIFSLGFINLFFIKKIKRYRMRLYLKRRISYYKDLDKQYKSLSKYDPYISFNNEIRKLERIYKISKLHNKSKINKFKKIISFI